MALFDWFTGERPALVEQTFDDIVDMVERGRDMFLSATGRLLDNEILDVDLQKMDEAINLREQRCRSTALEYISSSPGNQLVFVLKLLSIVQEAERIGDLAKTLSGTADLAQSPRLGRRVQPLRTVRDRILTSFDLTLGAFMQDDSGKAGDVLRQHQEIKDQISAYLESLSKAEGLSSNEGVVYALSARMLGRTSSHLANIASAVVFPFDQIRRTVPDNED